MACYCFGNKLLFKITNPAHFFKSLPARRDRSPVSPGGFYCSFIMAPHLVQCQKIATLLGLASSRRATDWLWVETDTDDCAIFLLLWTALTIKDYKCLEKKERKRFQTLIFTFPYPNNFLIIFVLRKKGSKTKERMKEEEIEKGDCGPPTRKVFFWFCRTWTKRYLITSQTRVKRVSRIHHRTILRMEDGPVVYPANAFDSRLRGD